VSSLSQDDVRNMPAFEYDDSMMSLGRNRANDAGTPTDRPAAAGAPGDQPAVNGTGAATRQ